MPVSWTEWLIVGVLVAVPLILLFFRGMRRVHWPVLVIIWLIALVGWIFLTERSVLDCFTKGSGYC